MQKNLQKMNAIAASQEVVAANYNIDMKKPIDYRKACDTDIEKICRLLEEDQLPTVDIKTGAQEFLLAEDEDGIAGNIGLESYEDVGLLRSMVVSSNKRNAGIASALVEQLLAYASGKGIRKLYLVTNTAEGYFERKGFRKINREEVDEKLLVSAEFNGLCPASSVIMMKTLK
jgi:amino-acid N-acetyltransferase